MMYFTNYKNYSKNCLHFYDLLNTVIIFLFFSFVLAADLKAEGTEKILKADMKTIKDTLLKASKKSGNSIFAKGKDNIVHVYDQANLVMGFANLGDLALTEKATRGLLTGVATSGQNEGFVHDWYYHDGVADDSVGEQITLGDQAEAFNAFNAYINLAKRHSKTDSKVYSRARKARDELYSVIEKKAKTRDGLYRMMHKSHPDTVSTENASRYTIAKFNYGLSIGGTEGKIIYTEARQDMLRLIKATWDGNSFRQGPKDRMYAGDVAPLLALAVEASGSMNNEEFLEFAKTEGYSNMEALLRDAMANYLHSSNNKIMYDDEQLELNEYASTFLEAARLMNDSHLIQIATNRLQKGPQSDYNNSPITLIMQAIVSKGNNHYKLS